MGKLSDIQRVGIKFEMDNLFYSDNLMKDYTSLGLNPYYAIDEDSWRLHLGAHVDWMTGNDSGIDVARTFVLSISSPIVIFFI